MRIGGEPVGPKGLVLLGVTAVAGVALAAHGWSGRSAGLAPGSLAASGAPARASASAGHSSGMRSPSPAGRAADAGPSPHGPASPGAPASPRASSAAPGPLLSSESFASYAFRIWPGTPSAAASSALTGLSISVHRTGSGLSVVAGVVGQPRPAAHFYPGGARVYVIEASMGDDSGNSDYNLGDDGLAVTDTKGRIIQ